MKIYTIMGLFLLILTILAGAASALPISIDRVEIDDIELSPSQTNRLDLERNKDYDIEVRLSTTQDVDDVEVRIFVSGFEFNDIDEISDRTRLFDADANVTYIKRLRVRFTDEVDEDDYKVRVLITNRDGTEVIENYNVKIDVPRHDLKIEDVVFFPNQVMSGQAALATVRIENKGEKDEDDVRVQISIPDLGISGVDYIDEIESGDEEETEEIFMLIPKCENPGIYPVEIRVEYNQRRVAQTYRGTIEVLDNPSCRAGTAVEDDSNVKKVQIILPQPEETDGKMEEEQESTNTSSVRKWLEITLLVLVALLIIVGLIIGFSKLSEKDDEL